MSGALSLYPAQNSPFQGREKKKSGQSALPSTGMRRRALHFSRWPVAVSTSWYADRQTAARNGRPVAMSPIRQAGQ